MVPLSLGRRIICDLMHVSIRTPTVSIQKDMFVTDLMTARRLAQPRPSWCSIFTKAYSKVVASRPELRRAFLSFPWERMFEYHVTTADVAVEMDVGDETAVVGVPLNRPDSLPLLDIDRLLAGCRERPLEHLGRYRRARALARWPRLVRHCVWWYILNVSGQKRSRYFGTFGVTTVGNWGVDSLRPLSPCISLLHYGAIDGQGKVTVRLTFDHRVLDGSAPAQALLEMEHFLATDILAELVSLRGEQDQKWLAKAG